MNYFEKHIGDYIRDTVSLSMLEDGAYNRLIDQYYQSEKPLPADKKEVYRLARATSTPERKAVEYVLQRYFQLGDDGYHHKRCDAVIEAYWERDQSAENKRENDRERQRRARERRQELFDSLRAYGVVPAFNTPTKQLQAELSRVTRRDNKRDVTPPVARDNTATQTPIPKHQSPRGYQSASPDQPPLADPPPAAADPLHSRAIELTALLRKRGAALHAADPRVRQWASDGVSDAQALSALEAAQARRHEQGNPQPVNAGYLDAILRRTGSRPARDNSAAIAEFVAAGEQA